MHKSIITFILSVGHRVKKMFSNIYQRVGNFTVSAIAAIRWNSKRVLTTGQHTLLKEKLENDYYIILTRHPGFLSTYAIAIAHLFLTGKKGYYGHALMNLEDTVEDDRDYRFIEATTHGVKLSGWQEVFDPTVGSVALLKPVSMTLEHWTEVLDKAKTDLGKPYDTLFDLANDQSLSCVELVRNALRNEPNYDINFANFERKIRKAKNLDPQMFYECEDFHVVYEIKN